MKSRTVVCVYGKNEPIDRVMQRLRATFLSNYSKSYVYGAIIDLPDAISYRVLGDLKTEERAGELIGLLKNEYGDAFFCAIRQRRICSGREYRYVCEEGALGAVKTLWRYSKGKSTELFPIFGCGGLGQAERIYFSAEVGAESGESIDVIQPNGIFALAELMKENEAVFASAGAIIGKKAGELGQRAEVLFDARALDKLLGCGDVPYKSATCLHIGTVRYPASRFAFFEEKSLLL